MLALLPSLVVVVLAAGRAGAPSPGLGEVLGGGLVRVGPLLATCVVAAVVVAQLAARLARRPALPGAYLSGAVFALALPTDAPLVASAAAVIFGVALGREIFGALERTFVHPAVLAHVFLGMTWPKALGASATWAPGEAPRADSLWPLDAVTHLGAASLAACALGAVLLASRGLLRWRVLLGLPFGAAVVFVLSGAAASGASLAAHFVYGGLAFAAVFTAADPAAAPRTPSGQWFHGALVGALVIALRTLDPGRPEGSMTAILLASVLWPLVDRVVLAGRARLGSAEHA